MTPAGSTEECSNNNQHDDGWDCGWEEHKLRQLVRMSRLTMAQKLHWLEDMQRLFEQFSRKKPSNDSSDLPQDK